MAVTRYQEAADEHRRMIERERAPMEKELAEIGRRLERAQVMFMEEVIDLAALKARTAPLETRRQELSALLSDGVAPGPVQLRPGIAEAHRRLAENLHLAIEGDADEYLREELAGASTATWPSFWASAGPRKQKPPQSGTVGVLACLGAGARSGRYLTPRLIFAA